jgi:hypothetical protein
LSPACPCAREASCKSSASKAGFRVLGASWKSSAGHLSGRRGARARVRHRQRDGYAVRRIEEVVGLVARRDLLIQIERERRVVGHERLQIGRRDLRRRVARQRRLNDAVGLVGSGIAPARADPERGDRCNLSYVSAKDGQFDRIGVRHASFIPRAAHSGGVGTRADEPRHRVDVAGRWGTEKADKITSALFAKAPCAG